MNFRIPALTLLFALLAPLAGPGGVLTAQDAAVQAYYGGIADHFDLPAEEVRVLSEWQIQPEEVPVALFMARQGGISVDALMALEGGGQSWSALAARYDLGASHFHVPLPAGAAAGLLSSLYERFAATPRDRWDTLTLSDAEIVHLVNIRVLSEHFDTPPARVLEARSRSGSFVEAYRSLARSGG